MQKIACIRLGPSHISKNALIRRAFSSSGAYRGTFDSLGRLSVSRETQWFTKASGLSRVEHSPPLEQIRSSEVKPFQRHKPQTKPEAHDTISRRSDARPPPTRQESFRISTDAEAIAVGQKLLLAKNRDIERLEALIAERNRKMEELQQKLSLSQAREEILQRNGSRRHYASKSRKLWTILGLFAAFGVGGVVSRWDMPLRETRQERALEGSRVETKQRNVAAGQRLRDRQSPTTPAPVVTPPVTRPVASSVAPPVEQPAARQKQSWWSSLLWDRP